jgi:hypothetical protein
VVYRVLQLQGSRLAHLGPGNSELGPFLIPGGSGKTPAAWQIDSTEGRCGKELGGGGLAKRQIQ